MFAETLGRELIRLSEEVSAQSTESVEELMRQDEIVQLGDRQQAMIRQAATRVFGSATGRSTLDRRSTGDSKHPGSAEGSAADGPGRYRGTDRRRIARTVARVDATSHSVLR